jgi:hypothetical protein
MAPALKFWILFKISLDLVFSGSFLGVWGTCVLYYQATLIAPRFLKNVKVDGILREEVFYPIKFYGWSLRNKLMKTQINRGKGIKFFISHIWGRVSEKR